MSQRDLNLARRPFVNPRPVSRLAGLLWLLGAIFLATNIHLYWDYFSGSEDRTQELAELDERISEHRQGIAALENQLAQLDLEQQNQQITFLNGKIQRRTFSWSQLFDQLAEVLPGEVRLVSLSPQLGNSKKRRRQRTVTPRKERVRLQISAVAKTVDAQLEFVDNLFEHPAFRQPKLSRDSQTDTRQTRFELTVSYLPSQVAETQLAEAGSASSGDPAEGQTVAEPGSTGTPATAGGEGGQQTLAEELAEEEQRRAAGRLADTAGPTAPSAQPPTARPTDDRDTSADARPRRRSGRRDSRVASTDDERQETPRGRRGNRRGQRQAGAQGVPAQFIGPGQTLGPAPGSGPGASADAPQPASTDGGPGSSDAPRPSADTPTPRQPPASAAQEPR